MIRPQQIRILLFITAICCSHAFLHAQPYTPATGEAAPKAIASAEIDNSVDDEAISADDEAIRFWAVSCVLERGPAYILFPDSIEVTIGEAAFATGKAGNEVVSLGDGGSATLTFDNPVSDGPGPDLAVFENSFDGNFLELGFVEVSSDAENFIRFPASSLTSLDTQIGPFGVLDAEKIHNLAGKYSSGWGTPFDLSDLKDSSGLDLNHIIAVRIIDVIGILDENLGSRDAEGRLINDPFPTPWENGGFDLDAVGVLNSSIPISISASFKESGLKIYPNPFSQEFTAEFHHENHHENKGNWAILDLNGRVLKRGEINSRNERINLNDLREGIYLFQATSGGSRIQKKIIKNSR